MTFGSGPARPGSAAQPGSFPSGRTGGIDGADAAFAFLDPVASLRPALQAMRDHLGRNHLFLAIGEQQALASPIRERRLATFARDAQGNWRFKRIYLSYQPEGPLPRSGFRGHTFFYTPKRGELLDAPFPADPGLPSAGRVVDGMEHAAAAGGAPVEVLRYVPMRRLTLRGGCDAAGPGPDIVKVVEGKNAGPIAARIGAVSDAATWAGASFRVARVKECRPERGVFVQECLPGRPLAGEIGPDALEAPLRRIGAIHAEIHALHAAGPHVGALKDPWPTVVERLDWLAFVRPAHAEVFRAVAARLETARPAPGEPVFCHGDFRCTQILADGGNWSVIDFDDAGYGDASLDVGRFLAFLKYDVPALAGSPELLEQAAAAYLDGYAGRAGRVPASGTLRWHRTSQEVLYLAQLVRRDLADEPAFAAGCAELDRLSAGLRPGETR